MGSKTAEKRNSAVLIPQHLRPQEKNRGHSRGWPLFAAVMAVMKELPLLGGQTLHRYIKEKTGKKLSQKDLNFLITLPFETSYSAQIRVLCVAE